MAISNMQQARQLRAGGGIMDLEPRQGYFLGKLVKKVTRPLKKIAKSPLGKAALIGGLGMYGMGAGPFSGVKGSGFLKGLLSGGGRNLLTQITGKAPASKGFRGFLGSLNPFGGNFSGQNAFLAGNAGLTALPFLLGGDEDEGEIVGDEFDITPDTISNIRQMSRIKDPSLAPFRIADRFAQKNYYLANGGVVGVIVTVGV